MTGCQIFCSTSVPYLSPLREVFNWNGAPTLNYMYELQAKVVIAINIVKTQNQDIKP